MIISRSVILRMRNVSYKSGRENKNTHFVFHDHFPEILPFWYNVKKIVVEPDRPRMTAWHMRTVWWTTKATNTNPAYVILSFSTATVVARTRSRVTLYVLCLPCNQYFNCSDFRTSNVITIACCTYYFCNKLQTEEFLVGCWLIEISRL
jgi:hypothetical protein